MNIKVEENEFIGENRDHDNFACVCDNKEPKISSQQPILYKDIAKKQWR
jgi:hypothetical protein